MTTPSSEAARAEAERRYPVFDNEVTDFSTARRAAFVAGAEWKGAQVEERYAGLIACVYGLAENMSFRHETDGWVTTFQDKGRAVLALDGIRAWLEVIEDEARTLQEEGSE